MITKDLGMVTAYAYAVSKGYTGTEAQFAELMASYATVGQEAVDAALAAAQSAQAADQSAQAAASAKDEAEEIVDNFATHIQADVDNWLDDHPEATTTVDFSVAVKVFPNVAAMVADSTLKAGDNVATRGYYESGDNGGTNYVISNSHNGVFYQTLNNGLYANLLNESKIMQTDIIGFVRHASQTDALNDSNGMAINDALAQKAMDARVSLVFGYGCYAFGDSISLKPGIDICGVRRENTKLYFPNGMGIVFSENAEYSYRQIKKLSIFSDGDCIHVSDDVRNVINYRFDYLRLDSENGECFVAPRNNEGSNQGDTCVWSCFFGHISGRSGAGAIIANVKGLGNWFYFFNMLGDTKIAFRNCSGVFYRFDTLCNDAQYAFYYDDVSDHQLQLQLNDFHFEGLSKAFIYTEDQCLNTMAIGVWMQDSGSTNERMRNSTIPPIRVGRLLSYIHYGKYNALPSTSCFDMNAIKARVHVHAIDSTLYETFKTNVGGTSGFPIHIVDNNKDITFYVTEANRQMGVGTANWYVATERKYMNVNAMFGGRRHVQVSLNDTNIPASQSITVANIDSRGGYADYLLFTITNASTQKNFKSIRLEDSIPGKFLCIRNNNTSTETITLLHPTGNESQCIGYANDITIAPGYSQYFVLDYYGGVLRWIPITFGFSQP